jgi:hypothetical protein
MKHAFSKATLDKAARLARKNGHAAVAALIGGWPLDAEEELFEAARRGDEKATRRLLGVEPRKIGERIPDGTIYAGISPDSGKAIYAATADAPLTMRFEKAADYAKNLQVHGHNDWRLPTRNELELLFNNRAAIGGFRTASGWGAHWYWSSTEYRENQSNVWSVSFTDGAVGRSHKTSYSLSARVIRS